MSEKEKMMMLVEGVAFVVGLLIVAVAAYYTAVEAIRNTKRSQ
jgi:predicted ribosomally synthesized peptide with SipW-like signal peptide